ncbi:MAG TPA: GNAT family N-acetyltransferase [Acidimicrobiales bacterium]|jgi:ribosomal protein S18 acetylase RimI-like enzyme
MVTLREKSKEELVTWIPETFAGYIEERIGAGESRASAETNGKAQQEQLFPGGLPAEGQHAMNVLDGDEVVGTLWMGKPFGNLESTWFVFYVEIDEAHRGRGLGRAAMQAAEDWTKEHDGTRVALNVFGPNVVARSLYDSLGYQVMATAMFKDL